MEVGKWLTIVNKLVAFLTCDPLYPTYFRLLSMYGSLRRARDDAGVVYVASLLFNDAMMLRLSQDLEKLTKGARVISLRPIPPPSDNVHSTDSLASGNASLRLTYEGVFKMSWQMARVYIYVRT